MLLTALSSLAPSRPTSAPNQSVRRRRQHRLHQHSKKKGQQMRPLRGGRLARRLPVAIGVRRLLLRLLLLGSSHQALPQARRLARRRLAAPAKAAVAEPQMMVARMMKAMM